MDGQVYHKEDNHIKLSFVYNVITGMVPSYIQYSIPPLVSEASDYHLRNCSI